MITALFADRPANWVAYEAPLRTAFADAGLDVNLVSEADPATVDYVIYAPASGLQDFTPFTRLKAVLSLWAGVETIQSNATIRVPLCRMVDSGLAEGMRDYVTGHILRYHLGMDAQAQDGVWRNDVVPPLARDRVVGFLGLGELGQTCAIAAAGLGFQVLGWGRRLKSIDGVTCIAGEDGLRQVLAQADILVLLLPDTSETENLLNAETLAMLPKGARIINPGRGTLIDDGALLDALETGQVGGATLDVFREEPLPANHPYWAHPNVTVTPHIASETRPETAALTIAENIRRMEAGEPLLHVVDRVAGY